MRSAGGQRRAIHAGKIFKGLLEAVLATGDGKTPETAFLVQGIAEESLPEGEKTINGGLGRD